MTLFRYVFVEYLKFVAVTLLLCLFLFVIFDFSYKSTAYYARYSPAATLIIKVYLLQLPFQMVQILPIAAMISSLAVMVLLNRTNEVTAMRAAGMGPLQIAAPLACAGLLLCLGSYVLSEWIVPEAAQRMYHVLRVQIEGEPNQGSEDQSHWLRVGSETFNFQEYSEANQTLRSVEIVSLGPGFLPQRVIHAERAVYQPASKTWLLKDVRFLSFDSLGVVRPVERKDSLERTLPLEPSKLKIERRVADEMGLQELHDLIDNGQKTGADVSGLRVAYHVKWAYPIAALLISLLGLKFGYRSERTTETVKSILLAFTIGISYWLILSAVRALASAGDIPPMLGAWLPNAFICVVVSVPLWRLS